MKLSISLPAEDVATLDEVVRAAGLPSRSAAVQRAVRALRQRELEVEYAAAWDEWATDDADRWDSTADDGLTDAPR